MSELSAVLNSFCSTEKEILRKPTLKDNVVYISDSWILGIIPLGALEKVGVTFDTFKSEVDFVRETEKTPDFGRIPSERFREDLRDLVLTYDTVLDYSDMYQCHRKTCADCGGVGVVDFTFDSVSGDVYTLEGECPTCKGTGVVDRGIVAEFYKNYPVELSYFPSLARLMTFFRKKDVIVYPVSENFLRLDFGDFYFIVTKSLTTLEILDLSVRIKSYIVSYQDKSHIGECSVKIFCSEVENPRVVFGDIYPEGVVTMIEEI